VVLPQRQPLLQGLRELRDGGDAAVLGDEGAGADDVVRGGAPGPGVGPVLLPRPRPAGVGGGDGGGPHGPRVEPGEPHGI